jgi:hypothetical protein
MNDPIQSATYENRCSRLRRVIWLAAWVVAGVFLVVVSTYLSKAYYLMTPLWLALAPSVLPRLSFVGRTDTVRVMKAFVANIFVGCVAFAAICFLSDSGPYVPLFVEPIQSKYHKLSKPSLIYEKTIQRHGYPVRLLKLINPSRPALEFTGYSESSPWYRIQYRENDGWTEIKVGWWCGTGLRWCQIRQGESAVIDVDQDLKHRLVRVGVELRDGRVIWSDEMRL